MAKGKGGGAPYGNKNASRSASKTVLANVGGVVSGLLHKPIYNEKALETYKRYGAGATGYKVGKITRTVATLGLERIK